MILREMTVSHGTVPAPEGDELAWRGNHEPEEWANISLD